MQNPRDPFVSEDQTVSEPPTDDLLRQLLGELQQRQSPQNQAFTSVELPPAPQPTGFLQTMATASPLILALLSGVVSVSIAWAGMKIQMASVDSRLALVEKGQVKIETFHKVDLGEKLTTLKTGMDQSFERVRQDGRTALEAVTHDSDLIWQMHDNVYKQQTTSLDDDLDDLEKKDEELEKEIEALSKELAKAVASKGETK